ncbi:MAG TPA: ABC transporter permease [Rubrivivax sp.]|nr:ABC transporter permease [Rubrivivax sp.]
MGSTRSVGKASASPRATAWPWGGLALAWPLAKRDVLARYRGSVAGLAWALVAPLGMVLVYTLVFRGVFRARWGVGESAVDGFGYVTRLFAGLMVFQAVAEVATRATRLMQDHANLVKRVVFPLELLCTALLLQVGVHLLLQVALLAVFEGVFGGGVRLSWLLLPLALLWLLLLMQVLALALAALGAYLRDLQHAVPVMMTGMLFLSPVFFPAASAPEPLRWVLAVNPISVPIELMRWAWFGDPVDVRAAVAQGLLLLLLLPLAHRLFRRLRTGFADLV